MTVEKDKADPAGPTRMPAAKTVVGVPAILPSPVPPDRPSDLAMTRELPPKEAAQEEEAPTVAKTSLSPADAARLLEGVPTPGDAPAAVSSPLTGRAPSVAGAVRKPAVSTTASAPIRTPPLGGDMFAGLPRGAGDRGLGTERPTRAGVAPLPGIAPKGRSTLLLDASVPAPGEVREDGAAERPPIVVPASGAMAPKAVTQPPPWGEGAAHVGSGLPSVAHRDRESIEEISGSMLLPADASGEARATAVEELSGSLLLEDADAPGVIGATKPPVPSSAPPRSPSVKPPLPTSASARPPAMAHATLLGMPNLPKTTPAPKLDFVPSFPTARVSPATMPLGIPVPAPVVAPGPVPAPESAPDPSSANVRTAIAPEPPGVVPPNEGVEPGPSSDDRGAPQTMPPAPMTGDIELTQLPQSGAQRLLQRVRELVRRGLAALPENTVLRAGRRPVWFLPVIAVGGLIVGIGLVGLVISAARGGRTDHESPTATSANAPASPSSTARAMLSASAAPLATGTAVVSPSASSAARAPAPAVTPCTVTGKPHVIGPSATLAAGVEVVNVGAEIALGFAPTDHDAIAVKVDPTSLNVTSTTKARSRDPVRRVTPTLGARGTLGLNVDADRKGDRLQGRRTVPASAPLQLGAADGHVDWAHVGGGPAGQLWPLDDSAAIDALRGAVDPGSPTIAVAFRRSNAVWMGTVSTAGGMSPVGPLARVPGIGTAVGSPAVAVSSGGALVAWADRASPDDPWRLRRTRFDAGGAPDPAITFTPPSGDHTNQTMAPGIAVLPGDGFLLVWTEGPASGHAVRALTLAHDGAAVGAALTISNEGVNAGQGQAAITTSGNGVVAFLESRGTGYQVVATPIVCGRP